jgi:hypothetical protein
MFEIKKIHSDQMKPGTDVHKLLKTFVWLSSFSALKHFY